MLRYSCTLLLAPLLAILLASCSQDSTEKEIISRADSLFISVRSIHTVTGLITQNFLLPGQKKTEYRIGYINETWPDTITRVQANKLLVLKDLYSGFDKAVAISKSLQERSLAQLQQLKKLNHEINSGEHATENLLQYLTFEAKCADSLNRALDTLVKRSIELSCRSQSF